MSYKVLALKWRPNSFDEIIGQNHVTRSLKNAIKLNRVSHAFTFSGPRGVGKTTTARILSKELNKIDDIETSFDIIEMDAASNRGIDEIRNLRENVSILPAHGKYKIYIIDEVHMLTKEAFNALLKTLEEPPDHVIFILATTDPYKIPSTIISRTQRYDFRKLSSSDIIQQIKIILDNDEVSCDEKSLILISEKADGSMRDALGFLDQVLNYCDENIKVEDVRAVLGLVDDDFYNSLFKNIMLKKSLQVIDLIDECLNMGVSIQDFIFGFSQFLKTILISILNKNFNSDLFEDLKKEGVGLIDLDIIRMMELTMQFESKLKFYSQQGSALEVFMIKLCSLDNVVKISEFLDTNSLNNYENPEVDSNSSYRNKDKEKKILNENSTSLNEDSKILSLNHKESFEINTENNNKSIIVDSSIEKDNNKEKNLNNIVESPNLKGNQNIQEENIKLDDKKLVLDNVVSNYDNILQLIEEKNSKTYHFLEKSLVDKIVNNEVHIIINDINDFSFTALLNDQDLINNIFSDFFNCKCSIVFVRGSIREVEKDDSDGGSADSEHPLLMDVVNKFKGDILR